MIVPGPDRIKDGINPKRALKVIAVMLFAILDANKREVTGLILEAEKGLLRNEINEGIGKNRNLSARSHGVPTGF